MITTSKEFLEFAKKELVTCIMRFSKNIKENKANGIAEEILQVVDWNSSALMHKGFSWMAKNYLNQQKMI